MKNKLAASFLLISLSLLSLLTIAAGTVAKEGVSPFHDGPLIKGFGKHASVTEDLKLTSSDTFNVVFDAGKKSATGGINTSLSTLARFLNMHAANGIKPENLKLALVIHSSSAFDVLSKEAHSKRFQQDNPNHNLLLQLLENNVEVFVCGQTAAHHKISNSDLQPGVKMALSAMTAHALLQQRGYTLNPF